MATLLSPGRRCLIKVAAAALAAYSVSGCTPYLMRRLGRARVATDDWQDEGLPIDSPQAALDALMRGNRRYASGTSLAIHESERRRAEVAKEQKPFAMVFGCIDSRVPAELIFDAGLGDLLVVRTAGHTIDAAVLASLEFGIAELGVPLLVVLGHERCGAVTAAVNALGGESTESSGGYLVDALRPAVEQSTSLEGDPVGLAVHAHTGLTVTSLRERSPFAEASARGALMIVGAHYDLDTGVVTVTVP